MMFDLAKKSRTLGLILALRVSTILDCSAAPAPRRRLFEGDIEGINAAAVAKSISKKAAGNGVVQTYLRWKDGIIPYEIADGFTIPQQAIILDAIDNFGSVTCLQFLPKDDQAADYLSIVVTPGDWSSCGSSKIGRWQGQQPVSIASNCVSRGIIQHELMHAVGFYHEQSRVDRDDYVDINTANLDPGVYRDNFQKYTVDEVDDFGFAYDFASVMHYEKNAFGINPDEWTIRPKSRFKEFTDVMGQRDQLSKTDIGKINAMYKCPQKISPQVPKTVSTNKPTIATTTQGRDTTKVDTTTEVAVTAGNQEGDTDTDTETSPPSLLTTTRNRRSRRPKTKNGKSNVQLVTEVQVRPSEEESIQNPDTTCEDVIQNGQTCTKCTTMKPEGGSTWVIRCGGQDSRSRSRLAESQPVTTPVSSAAPSCRDTVEAGQSCTICTTVDASTGRSRWTRRCRPGSGRNGMNLKRARQDDGDATAVAEGDINGSTPNQTCVDTEQFGQTCTRCTTVEANGRSRWNQHCRW